MRKVVLTVVTGLLIVGYTGVSRAQDVVLHTVTFTASLDCTPGVESGVQIYVDARGPSPGDIIIAGSIQGCQPELGPFLDSSTICDNRPEMLGAVSAEDREDANNMDAGEFTMKACETGSRTFDGAAGTGGTAGAGGTGGRSGAGGDSIDPDEESGSCGCIVQSSELDGYEVGLSLLLIGVLAARRLRKRRR